MADKKGDILESIKNLSTGPNSDSYYFQTKNGKYVLRYIHDHPSSSKIEQTCKILRYLKKNTMSVQDLINTDNDKFCDSKNFIYVTKFYEGILSKGTFAEIKDLAMNVALLHKFLYKTKIKFDFEHDIDPSFRILTLFDINRIRKIIVQMENKTGFDNKILNSLEFLKQIVSEQKKKQIKLRSYKFQLIHNDLSEKNEVFGCLRRDLYVTVLFKQTSNTVAGDFLGRLVLGIEDNDVKVFGATIF